MGVGSPQNGAMRAFPRLVVAGLALPLALAGCAQAAPPGAVVASPEPSGEPEPSPTVTWRSEAPVTLKPGVPTDLSQTRGLSKAIVTVESITEKAECPSGEAQPQNGQFIAVKLSAQRLDSSEGFTMSVYDWGTVDNAGKTTPGSAGLLTGLCLKDGSGLKLAWDSSGRANGTLIIDAPADVQSVTATNTMATPNVTVTLEMPAR